MSILFSSDHHFGHANIRLTRPRFSTLQNMDDFMVAEWNRAVQPEDTVYHLGDLVWKPDSAESFLERLNGRIKLVPGNHDNLKALRSLVHRTLSSKLEILESLVEIKHLGHSVTLCHYPMAAWNKSHHGSLMLHGHTHGNLPFHPKIRRLDVGVDSHDFRPWTWGEICARLEVPERAVPRPSLA